MMRRWHAAAAGLAAGTALFALLVGQPTASFGQQASGDPLQDPLLRGAWLYEGNCVRCHGAYQQERVARGLDEDEIVDALEGGSGGCSVDWSAQYGGPLRSRDLKAIAAYLATWETLGEAPELAPLPPQPTPTPLATPAAAAGDSQSFEPTATPTPSLDPVVRVAIDGSDLALGAWLYTQHCHRCHLSYEEGRMGRSLGEETVERNIRQGKVGTSMPAFDRRQGGELRFREIEAILAYIQAWEMLGEPPALPEALFVAPTPDPAELLTIKPLAVAPVSGDPQQGARLYVQHCASCHGLYGEGGVGSRLAKAWPSLRPDLLIWSTIANGVPGSLMPAWEEKQDGLLSEQEINDLVALILQW
jgi:mono/diheme cytochrome c family protein